MAISLQRLDEENLERVLLAAVAGAAPQECMPAVPGPPGWTARRRAAFRAFHRERFAGLDGRHRELTFACWWTGGRWAWPGWHGWRHRARWRPVCG